LYRAARVVFVNAGDEVLREKGERRREKGERRRGNIIYYGSAADPSLDTTILEMNPCLLINLFGNKVQTHLIGSYNLPNILGAAAIGRYFDVPVEDICSAISEYTPQNNRSQIIKKDTNTIIADYYNANPTSMRAALDNFLQIENPLKLAILGDMLELGKETLPEHQAIIDFCKTENLKAIFIGTNFRTLKNKHFPFFTNVQDCNEYLQEHKVENTLILLKGSRGVRLEEVVL
jgi:UDP-N-acetylmuramoyl-tripeptide--D-alanyl-D-alanine ligase